MQLRFKLSLLAFTVALPALTACENSVLDPQIMASGYGDPARIEHRSVTDVPPGYSSTAYKARKQARLKEPAKSFDAKDEMKQIGWSQAGLDLALMIDDKIGVETQLVSLSVKGQNPELSTQLSYYLRAHLRDLGYKMLDQAKGVYHIEMFVMPLAEGESLYPEKEENNREKSSKMVLTTSRTQSLRNNEDKQDEYDKESKGFPAMDQNINENEDVRDVRVDTIIFHLGNEITKTRSAHSLVIETQSSPSQ